MTRPRLAALTALSLAALLLAGPALAQGHAHQAHGHSPTQAAPASADELADGEVRRIDVAAGKVTLRHGEIKSLDMPPMTMVFTVAEPGMLGNLKVGDRIRFAVEQQQGRMVVTRIVPAP